MSVHYKFKSSLDFDTITFDGLHISVNDFRKAVVQQKRLGKTSDFELQITNAQTKEEYEHDNDLIPKNTSLIISRIPQTSKKPRDSQNQNTPNVCHVPKFDGNTLDLSQMNASEEDKIQAMMAQSTVDYDPRGYQKIRGPGQTGEVPPTYRCYKCHQTGHWIKNCPLPHSSIKKSEIRRNTGIPKSFLQEKDEKEAATDKIELVEKQLEVPDELLCSICKDIFRDAVMIPCCGSSFCDDCVRTELLESEENECPDCKEKGTSPGSLIPNRFLRSSVNTFKNETGYERKRKNNGVNEVVTNAPACVSEILTDKNTETEKTEKRLTENIVPEDLLADSTSLKLTPEREDSVPLKMEISESKRIDDEKRPRKLSVEPNSPKRHVEVVIPQRELSHNSEVQTRSEDSFKPINPSTFSNYGSSVPDLQHRTNNADSYPVRSDSFMRHTKQGPVVGPPHIGYCNNYENRTDRYYYPRDSYNVNATQYPFLPNTRCRPMASHSNIQPYYQGMSGAMETGIIEDPLEAFNRIMKEKEKRKEMKRFASDRHRSIAVKRGPRDPSPNVEKRRHRMSPVIERRNRSPLRPEKSSSHRNIERDKNNRSHRSHYAGNKRSFSRSNSPLPQRRYSKSPRRRSRSRSHPRSHSKEFDSLRHDSRPTKHVVQQNHRSDYDKDILRYNKKASGRFSESRNIFEVGPKENRKNSSKTRENGNQIFDNYSATSSRKAFIETDNIQDNRDLQYGFYEKKNKVAAHKSEDNLKVETKCRDNEDLYSLQPEYGAQKQEIEKKANKKKKKEKDEKTEKKSKKDKKEKKKREKHKDEPKKHSEHKKLKKEVDSISTANAKSSEQNKNQIRISKKDNCKGFNEETLDDKNETFTPDININRNLDIDEITDERNKEDNTRLSDDNNISNSNKSPTIFKSERYNQNMDNNHSELNTPTSFVDTTPENYAGKWDNFDFSMPNSEDIRVEIDRDCEYDPHDLQNSSPTLKNNEVGSSSLYNKKTDFNNRLQQCEERKSKYDDVFIEKNKEKRSELSTKIVSRKSSPTPSEAISSSSNNSNSGKTSQSKKRRKKSKHKKDKQSFKRSSSAESSKNSKKNSSKHRKSRSEKKKKTKRNESR